MSSMWIDLPKGETRFEPGAEIDVTVGWELERAAEAVELRVVWNTEGKGTTDVGVEQCDQLALPRLRDSRQLKVRLPRSPYSFSGRLVSLVWALELVALPSEDSARVEITIGPEGREVDLLPADGSSAEAE